MKKKMASFTPTAILPRSIFSRFTRSSLPFPSPSRARLYPFPPLHALVFTRSSLPFPSPSRARLYLLVFTLSLPFTRSSLPFPSPSDACHAGYMRTFPLNKFGEFGITSRRYSFVDDLAYSRHLYSLQCNAVKSTRVTFPVRSVSVCSCVRIARVLVPKGMVAGLRLASVFF